jgi:hypothetical protein
MDAESLRIVGDRCQKAKHHNDRMRALVPTTAASSLRTSFARCAIDLAIEHHAGLLQLIDAGKYGTAAALLRPILEAAATGYWLVYIAECDFICKLPTTPVENPLIDVPMLGEMLKDLTSIFPAIATLSDGLKPGGSAKWLHKYTHGSAPQLVRRVGPGWTEGEVMLTLLRADMFSDLAACLETIIAPNPALTEYAFNFRDELGRELQEIFGTAQVPSQPHFLPPAPLLADGCGAPL